MLLKSYSKGTQLSKSLKALFFFAVIIFTTNSFCQKKISSTTEDFLSKNSLLHDLQLEKFFLHTNKTVYYAGEKVWFKAYVANDADNKPSLETTNLHVNFYNIEKTLISNQLFLVEDGSTHGDIDLPKELQTGKYYIELTTQWNQNFNDNSSITSIEVINLVKQNTNESISDNSNQSETSIKKEPLKIEFYPESSILLEDIINSISFTVKANSNPIRITGDIIDNTTGIVVSKIESNNFGMGSFKLYYRPNRSYSAKINYRNKETIVTLPKAALNGIIVKKNIHQKNNSLTSFIIKTNKNTLKSNNKKDVFAVLNRNGNAKNIIPIQLNRKALNYSFNLLKSDLFKGVNTITLFNKFNEPISEYSFFNHLNKQDLLNVEKIDVEKDSMTLSFNLKNNHLKSNLSVSLLPTYTKIYNNQSSIETSFLLAPYLEKGFLNLTDFFESNTIEKDIDLLIKTNVRKNSFRYKKEPKKFLLPENGITIKGNVSSNIKDLTNYKVMLSSEENNILLIDSIGASNSFSFSNLLLKHPSNYKLALLNQQGKIIKTGFKISQEKTQYKPNKLLKKKFAILNKANATKEKVILDTSDSSPPLLIDDSTLLDVVNIKGRNKNSYQKKEELLEKMGIKKSVLDGGFSNLFIVKENQALVSVYDYLYRIPGIKVFSQNPNINFTITTTRGKSSFLGNNNMSVYVDGVLSDTEYLVSRNISDFTAISVNSSGAGAGVTGAGGVINFYTKDGKFSKYKSVTNTDILISETEFGFSSSSNYENNQMIFANKLSKEYYGTIGWVPNFVTKPNAPNILKFNKNGHKNVKVIINGMDTEGNLIFKVVNFDTKAD
ncbi:MAG: hypothetical protein COA67_04300 [Lutibacter sp.]|nr:MAG: hypothetical protein COA67_04300 [Lutibacter sp.]